MSTTELLVDVKVDKAGRLVIPAHMRRALGLGDDGGVVEILDGPDGLELRAKDRAPASVTRDEHGLLVIDVDRRVTNDEVLAAIDQDRERRG